MMTQRAKLRRLAFIDLPSWSRGSRPSILRTYPWVTAPGSHGRPYSNLSAARLAAKGTTQDYLTHPSPIPAQKMMPFRRWLRPPGGTIRHAASALSPLAAGRRRRNANAPLIEAHQRSCKGHFQPDLTRLLPAPGVLFRKSTVELR